MRLVSLIVTASRSLLSLSEILPVRSPNDYALLLDGTHAGVITHRGRLVLVVIDDYLPIRSALPTHTEVRSLVECLPRPHLVICWAWGQLCMLWITSTYCLFIPVSNVRPRSVAAGAWVGRWLLEKLPILEGGGHCWALVEVASLGLVISGTRKIRELIGAGDL